MDGGMINDNVNVCSQLGEKGGCPVVAEEQRDQLRLHVAGDGCGAGAGPMNADVNAEVLSPDEQS